MFIPQIKMHSTMARITITSQPAIQEIEQPKPEIEIQQPRANLEIETTPLVLTIDQTKAWEDLDLKHIFVRIAENAQYSVNKGYEYISKKVQQGDMLMRIENEGNPIADIYKESVQKTKSYKIQDTPNGVELNYEPAKVSIQATPQRAIINITPQKAIHTYKPGVVNIEILQWNSLSIEV